MKNINDYKGTKTAIHCKTQEEWDKINSLIGNNIYSSSDFKAYGDESCLYIDGRRSSCKYAVGVGYTIIPASDFISTPRTIEQIETELEVLRNELAILKAESRPKKKIEFVKYLSSSSMELQTPDFKPKDFVSFKKIEINDSFTYDIIEATDSDGLVLVYLGHFNDGIK